MLRANKKGEWEVDWELTGKVALEGNYKLQEKVRELEKEIKDLKEEKEIRALNDRDNLIQIEKLEKENKNLKKELELVRKNTRANVETLDNMYGELVDLKKENKELQKDLEHRDSFFSIMWDVLANNSISNEKLAAILFCVVHEECGDFDLSKKELEIVKRFWKRKYC